MRMIQGKVLFIGDSDDISTLLVRILNRSGCQTQAINKKDALPILAVKSFDCVILDWVMDEDRDQKFCHQVRLVAPQTPVFLFTGISSGKEITLAFRDLPEERLSPIDLDTLVADVFQSDWRGGSEAGKSHASRGI